MRTTFLLALSFAPALLPLPAAAGQPSVVQNPYATKARGPVVIDVAAGTVDGKRKLVVGEPEPTVRFSDLDEHIRPVVPNDRITAELPGVDPATVDISFENNTLTLSGTKQPSVVPQEKDELRVYTAERLSGSFERAVRLPEYVEGDKISANYTNGVLTITVPKAEAARPRKITVNATGN